MAGCAASANPYGGGSHPAGFWLGLWQGFIAPIAFLISLANHSIGIYAVHNAGAWYDFGFLFRDQHLLLGHARRPAAAPVEAPEVPVDRSRVGHSTGLNRPLDGLNRPLDGLNRPLDGAEPASRRAEPASRQG